MSRVAHVGGRTVGILAVLVFGAILAYATPARTMKTPAGANPPRVATFTTSRFDIHLAKAPKLSA